MTNHANPQNDRHGGPGQRAADASHRQDSSRGPAAGDPPRFGGMRSGSDRAAPAGKGRSRDSQDLLACIDAIEDSCRRLRESLATDEDSDESGRARTHESSRSSGPADVGGPSPR